MSNFTSQSLEIEYLRSVLASEKKRNEELTQVLERMLQRIRKEELPESPSVEVQS